MTAHTQTDTAIARTERGLAIAGTRITLYDIMDYVIAQYPPKFIQALFNLTNEQIDAALSYIEKHRPEVETEYKTILKEAEELKQYWQERNRELFERIAAQPPKPGTEKARAKLKAIREKRASQV
ncbi:MULTISPECIES: DUF433 domain-containing protein [Spirulina sp. CCY15215]|uniref:DUF433 domain-containing protein n=1 Tax=Spirulina sp. CCY15215 TaxID=2767591 RepID=UPI00195154DC|nr:DUF433 domain-containing protein [Spirulina major]